MDAVTLRWVIVGEVVIAVVFGALVLRPDAWVYWRQLAVAALAAFIVVPAGVGLYFSHVDKKLRSTRVEHVERT